VTLLDAGYTSAGNDYTYQEVYAKDGGVIDFSGLTEIKLPISVRDHLEFMASDPNTIINLSSLVSINRSGSGIIKFSAAKKSTIQAGRFLLNANDNLSITDQSTLKITGDLYYSNTTESQINLTSGKVSCVGLGTQTIEVGGEDLGVGGAQSGGNFGIGQLVVGDPNHAVTVYLKDTINNGNRTSGNSEALYLFGTGGQSGLCILGGSTLIIDRIHIYAFIGGQIVHLNSLFPAGINQIPFDGGTLQLNGPGQTDPLQVLYSNPKGSVYEPLDTIDIRFNRAINPATFTLQDVQMTGPNGAVAITSIADQGNNAWRIYFNELIVNGIYQLSVGPVIEDADGHYMDQNRNGVSGENPGDKYLSSVNLNMGLQVHIVSPATNSEFGIGQTIHFAASHVYGKTPITYTWQSDIDGVLGQGETLNVSTLNLSTGQHTITLKGIDSASDEDQVSIILIILDRPDLVISNSSAPTSATTGKSISVGWKVTNSRNVQVGSEWTDSVYISEDDQIGNDTFLASQLRSKALALDEFYDQTVSVELPLTVSDGPKWIIIKTDSGDNVLESVETNNVIMAGPVEINSYPEIELLSDQLIMDNVSYASPQPVLVRGTAPVTWSLVNAPAGISIDPTTGVVTWASPIASPNPYTITIQATNSVGSGESSWKLTVSPGYRADVTAVDPNCANSGTPVTITGNATYLGSGDPAANKDVVVSIGVKGTIRNYHTATDSSGIFNFVWTPLAHEAGLYYVGASHPQGEPETNEAQFSLYGITAGADPNTFTVIAAISTEGSITLKNPADLLLDGIAASITDVSEKLSVSIVNCPASLAAEGQDVLTFAITAADDSIEQSSFNVHIATAQGAEVTVPIGVKVRKGVPVLSASCASLKKAMVRGKQTAVEFSITNVGSAPTSPVNVRIPKAVWLSLASSEVIPSLAAGESAKIILLLTPDMNLPLVPYSGSLVIDSLANDISMPFEFVCVSESKSDLSIIVVDEFTYYAAGAPKVAGADVVLKNPFTGEILYTGQTDTDGQYLFSQINEGYYKLEVKAESHNDFSGTIFIETGKKLDLKVFLSRNLVRYHWEVIPTTILDRYDFNLTIDFETNVPAPVITIDPPVYNLENIQGESMQVNYTITNHGLIAAENLRMIFGTHSSYEFKPLVENIGNLAAMSSVTVPVLIRNKQYAANNSAQPSSGELNNLSQNAAVSNSPPAGCYEDIISYVGYDLECGEDKILRLVPFYFKIPIVVCPGVNYPIGGTGSWYWTGGANYNYEPLPVITESGTVGTTPTPTAIAGAEMPDIVSMLFCDPCVQKRMKALLDCAINTIGYFKKIKCAYNMLFSVPFDCIQAVNKDNKNIHEIIQKCILKFLCKSLSCISEECGSALCDFYVNTVYSCFYKDKPYDCIVETLRDSTDVVNKCGLGGAEVTLQSHPYIFVIYTVVKCSYKVYKACDENPKASLPVIGAFSGMEDGETAALSNLHKHIQRLEAIAEPYTIIFGSPVWLECPLDEVEKITPWLLLFSSGTAEESEDSVRISEFEKTVLLNYDFPSNITDDMVITFLDRWNRSVDYWAQGYYSVNDIPDGMNLDFIDLENLQNKADIAYQTAGQNYDEGFTDLYAGISNAILVLQHDLENSETVQSVSNSVMASDANTGNICAQVRIELDQRGVISRDAFIAHLGIDNIGPSEPLLNVFADIEITDEQGIPCNSLFEIRPPLIQGLEGDYGSGLLPAGQSARIEWTIIPSVDAAKTSERLYYVCGALAYEIGGQNMTIPLLPAPITVLPNPSLQVKYFLERDVYSDDPFTADVVEPAVPFSLGIMVVNNGYGTAKDVSITSSLPKIVDNEKGLLVNFNILGTQVGTQSVKSSLKVDFGSIAPNQTSVARWLMTSSLQGKFIDYHADFTHVDGMGNSRLSLIENVEIHEMEHVVCVDYPKDDKLADFLVNDVPDIENMPDKVYSSDGAVLPVQSIDHAQVIQSGDAYILTVSCAGEGWQYIRVANPAAVGMALQSVVRSDGKVIRTPENAWQTHKIIREVGREAYAQDRLHIFDYCSAGTVTYTLNYSYTDTQSPVVATVDVQNIPNGQFGITVTDNTAVNIASFDSHDIQVRGPNGFMQYAQLVSADNIASGSLRSATYKINLPANRWTSANNGQYSLWIDPDAISDIAGNVLPASDQPVGAFQINYQKDGGIILNSVSKKRVGRTVYEYEYAATLLGWSGVILDKCKFEVLGLPAGATLVENRVTFNYVKPNHTVAGKGILKVRIDHAVLDTELTLDWTLSCHLMGDFNCDGVVDIVDVGSFALVWLEDNADFDIAPASGGDNIVNMQDFAVLAENWLITKE
jgi:hypothetical protein